MLWREPNVYATSIRGLSGISGFYEQTDIRRPEQNLRGKALQLTDALCRRRVKRENIRSSTVAAATLRPINLLDFKPETLNFWIPCRMEKERRKTYPAPILPRKFHTLTNDTNASTLSEPSASAIWARLLMAVRPDPVPQPMAIKSNLQRGTTARIDSARLGLQVLRLILNPWFGEGQTGNDEPGGPSDCS